VKLLVLDKADEDLERLFEFLEEKNPLAAQKAMLAIDEGIKTLLQSPYIGATQRKNPAQREHYVTFGRASYVLRYRIDEAKDTLVVIRIWHSRESRR